MFPSRRDFLFAATTAAAAGLMWSARRRGALAEEAQPQTTKIRLGRGPSLCAMPQYVVDELLAAEGVSQVDYVVSSTLARC